jgi:hypothetical protein
MAAMVEFSVKIRASDKERSSAGNVYSKTGENTIKIEFKELSLTVNPNITITKMQITILKPKPVDLKKILRLKHMKDDLHTRANQ